MATCGYIISGCQHFPIETEENLFNLCNISGKLIKDILSLKQIYVYDDLKLKCALEPPIYSKLINGYVLCFANVLEVHSNTKTYT